MLKKICFVFFLAYGFTQLKAQTTLNKNGALVNILKMNDPVAKQKKLFSYLKSFFGSKPLNTLEKAKVETSQYLTKYNVDDNTAYVYFIDCMCKERVADLRDANIALRKAIEVALKNGDHYLLYSFIIHLAFMQTSEGSTIEAVSSFRTARKEALILKDPFLQVIVDINISDIYSRNKIFDQSLSYLDQADAIVTASKLTDNHERLKNIILFNKAENYFRMGNTDSLKKYVSVLNDPARGTYKLYIYRKRTQYFLALLQHNYKDAIKGIIALKRDTAYKFDNNDEQNLADAYFNANMPDSAKSVINKLLADKGQNNHPEIKFHLYEALAAINEKENDYKQAANNFEMALRQSEDQINRLTKVGDISSQMNIDEMQNSYTQKVEDYNRAKLWLIFTLVVSGLTVTVAVVSYRIIRQKRYYELLIYDANRKELAFINSHEVRRHLANILGLAYMIKESEVNDNERLLAENHLLEAARELDESIRNIAQKLND